MKTIKNLICVAVLSVLTLLTVTAQTTEIDVNGLIICKKYTKTQIIEKLGQSTKYESWPGDFGGVGEEYSYNSDIFRFFDNGFFEGFTISNPKFKVLGGRIKVGDNISTLSSIPNCRFNLRSTVWPNELNISDLYISDYDVPILITHKNGLITEITYSTPL